MATNDKPVIVLINGGFHLPIHYYPLAERLKDAGYTVASPKLVSVGLDDSILDKTWEDDAQAARMVMQPHLDAGHELIVVGHSYGCIVATAVVEDNTVDDRRAKGLKGGVKAVVYIAGFVYSERGVAPAASLKGTSPKWWRIDGACSKLTDVAVEYLYHDVEPMRAELCSSCLMHQSLVSLQTPVKYCAAEIQLPKVYIACEKDRCLPYPLQLLMAEGAGIELIKIPTGHSPFLIESGIDEIMKVFADLDARTGP